MKFPRLLLACLFASVLFVSLALNVFETRSSNRVVAQSLDSAAIAEEYVNTFKNMSFSTMPPVTSSGSAEIPELGTIAWEVGQTIGEFLPLGSFYDSFNLQSLSMENIAQLAGISLDDLSIGDIGLSDWQSLSSLVTAIPELGNLQVLSSPLVQDLVSQVLGSEVQPWEELSIDQLIQTYNLGDLSLGSIDLSQYGLDSIPGFSQAALGGFDNWEQTVISQIPGLSNVPFTSFSSIPTGVGFIALHDVTYGEKEARRRNTITGSNKEGFKVPCNKDSCPHIELSGPNNLLALALHGKQWIVGPAQMVKGGHGLLGVVNGGKEPTGRHPYGKSFKVVLEKTDESKGLGDFALYFRYCKGIYGCTPYFIGPVPWFPSHEGDIVFVGFDTFYADPPSNVPSHPGLPPGTELPPGSEDNPITPTSDECETYKGVSMGAFEKAIATIESLGSGGYTAIGDWVCADDGTNCGRALGKYQFMTYNEVARNRILSKPGGANFLQRAASISASKADLSKEILTYFPPQEQEAAEDEWFKALINKAAGEGKSGDNLVERSGAMHNAGLYSTDGSASKYGDRVLEEYKKAKPGVDEACKQKGTCTGSLANPAAGYPVTSGYGLRVHPISGQARPHSGIDYGTPMNTPIKAADGGKVAHASWMGGYGNTVDITHCDGRLTRYAHLNQISVTRGGAVAKGQVIGRAGTTGRSTGPHLHFEVHVKGRAVDPNTQW